MPYEQGDIVLVTFPLTDLTSTEIRPAIVVSNSDINQTDDVILAAITTNLRDDEFSFRIDNNALSNPMHRPSEVRCHKLFTCDQNIIQRTISVMNDEEELSNLTRIIKRSFSVV